MGVKDSFSELLDLVKDFKRKKEPFDRAYTRKCMDVVCTV